MKTNEFLLAVLIVLIVCSTLLINAQLERHHEIELSTMMLSITEITEITEQRKPDVIEQNKRHELKLKGD